MQKDSYELWKNPIHRGVSLLYMHGVLPFTSTPFNDVDKQEEEHIDKEIEAFINHCEELNV